MSGREWNVRHKANGAASGELSGRRSTKPAALGGLASFETETKVSLSRLRALRRLGVPGPVALSSRFVCFSLVSRSPSVRLLRTTGAGTGG